MNRSELRTAIKDRLAIPSTGDGLITDAFVNTAINDALNRVSAERDWWWLASTTTLTFDNVNGAATLPTDFMRANQLVINSAPVQQIPFEDYINPLSDDTNYGWVIYGNEARINPVPSTNTSGTFYYFRSEPALSSDGATPILPPVYHYIIVCYGAYLCAARRQDESRASLYLQEYGNWLRTMNDDNRATIKKRIKFDRLSDYASWS
jgi:hypothetical protein